MLHITEGNPRNTFEWVKICEIGNPRHTDHRDIDQIYFLFSVKTFRQTVFIFYLNIQIRRNSHYRNMTSLFQHFHTWVKDCLISAEFVDDQSFDHLTFIFLQKFHRTDELCKDTASVNVSDQKYRSFRHLCHSHIYDIFRFQIDLCRASGSFDDDNVILCCQRIICFHNVRHQFLLIFEIVSGTHGSKNFSVYDHLRTHIIGRLQQDRVH